MEHHTDNQTDMEDMEVTQTKRQQRSQKDREAGMKHNTDMMAGMECPTERQV